MPCWIGADTSENILVARSNPASCLWWPKLGPVLCLGKWAVVASCIGVLSKKFDIATVATLMAIATISQCWLPNPVVVWLHGHCVTKENCFPCYGGDLCYGDIFQEVHNFWCSPAFALSLSMYSDVLHGEAFAKIVDFAIQYSHHCLWNMQLKLLMSLVSQILMNLLG